MVFHLMSSGEGKSRTGVLTPVPCPHTLLTLLDVTGLKVVPYKLMEDQGWALDMDVLHSALETAKAHCMPRAIFISNPGNPTGKLLTVASLACHNPFFHLQDFWIFFFYRSCSRQKNNRECDSLRCKQRSCVDSGRGDWTRHQIRHNGIGKICCLQSPPPPSRSRYFRTPCMDRTKSLFPIKKSCHRWVMSTQRR